MAYLDFVGVLHKKTKRDYVQRVVEHNKGDCAEVAIQYGKDYWDGDRQYGYGGYYYDGRWSIVAQAMIVHYGLTANDSILDVGCGKGFLLYEFTQLLPGIKVTGLDISQYAIANAKQEIQKNLHLGNATSLPFDDGEFTFAYSITTFHNLYNYELEQALKEMQRVCPGNKHITVESYRNEHEKANLLYWQLTCHAFCTPKEWEWHLENSKFMGDYGCIYFE